MNIVITGGMGFIGHNLGRQLKAEGHTVTALDDLRFVTDSLYNYRNAHSYDELKIADCTRHDFNPDTKADVVIHLACHPNQAAFDNAGLRTAWSNTTVSTNVVARWAVKQKAKLIYFSSSMVYGNWNGRISEDAELAPVNDYGRAKMFCELAILETVTDYVIIRPTAVYGPGDNPRRLISKWINLAKAGQDIPVVDDVTSLDLTHVYDVCRGIKQILMYMPAQQTYNISAGTSVKLAEVADYIISSTGSSSRIVYTGKETNMPDRGSLDITKANKHLLYTPSWDWTNGLKEMIETHDKLL